MLFTALNVYANNNKQVLHFECNGCNDYQMQLKATSKWFPGNVAEAHVFNEQDIKYKKFKLYKTVSPSEDFGVGEVFTKVVASPTQNNKELEDAFTQLVKTKREFEAQFKSNTFLMLNGGIIKSVKKEPKGVTN